MPLRSFFQQGIAAFAGLLFWLAAVLPTTLNAADAPVKFGVFPNLSARVLMETYQPLATHLRTALGKTVELQSTPDFKSFHQRTMAGDYDLLVTAPHLAWLAWKKAGYRPLLAYKQPVRGLVVVPRDSPVKKLTDLKGKRIATADALAIVVLRMQGMMEAEGMLLDRDFVSIDARTHNNAALQAHLGQADAAIIGALPYRKLAGDVRNNLRVIAQSDPLPSQVWLVGGKVTPQLEAKLVKAIESYMNAEAGRQFLEAGGFGGVHRLTRTELNQVSEDAKRVERLVGGQTDASARP